MRRLERGGDARVSIALERSRRWAVHPGWLCPRGHGPPRESHASPAVLKRAHGCGSSLPDEVLSGSRVSGMRRRACGRLCFPRHASGPLSIGKTRRCTCSRWKPGCARPAGRWVPLPCGGCNLPGAGRCGSVRRCCGFGGRTCGKLKRGSNRSSSRQCWRSAERRTLEPAGGVSCADFGIRWFGWDTRHGRMSWRISKGGLSGWYLSGGGRPGYPPASGGIRRDRGGDSGGGSGGKAASAACLRMARQAADESGAPVSAGHGVDPFASERGAGGRRLSGTAGRRRQRSSSLNQDWRPAGSVPAADGSRSRRCRWRWKRPFHSPATGTDCRAAEPVGARGDGGLCAREGRRGMGRLSRADAEPVSGGLSRRDRPRPASVHSGAMLTADRRAFASLFSDEADRKDCRGAGRSCGAGGSTGPSAAGAAAEPLRDRACVPARSRKGLLPGDTF